MSQSVHGGTRLGGDFARMVGGRYDARSMPRSVSAPASTAGAVKTRRTEPETGPAYARRLAKLSRTIGEAGVASMLVTNPKDVGYLTGFMGGDSYLLVFQATGAGGGGSRKPIIISDFRYQEELQPVEPVAEVFIRARSMIEAVAEVVGGSSELGEAGKLAIQAEHLSVAEKAAIGRKVGAKRLVDTTGVVGKQRVIKDAFEVGLIRKAAKIQEQALLAVLPEIKAGQTEAEVAARLEGEMKRRGSSEPGFQTIVAAGPNGSLPHYRPQQKKLAAGKPVLIDWGAVYQGYHSDMTRVFSLGKWPEKIAEMYKIVLEAQLAAADALAPGKMTTEIDGVARKIITKAGYAECFGHGLGHGLGLNGHEDPRLTNMLAGSKLEEGMVVTVEPGIYLPGVGGVRIEDDYVITARGAENLCSMKKTLEWCTL